MSYRRTTTTLRPIKPAGFDNIRNFIGDYIRNLLLGELKDFSKSDILYFAQSACDDFESYVNNSRISFNDAEERWLLFMSGLGANERGDYLFYKKEVECILDKLVPLTSD